GRRQQLRVLYSPWTRWGIGLAAALAIGIGIGRYTIGRAPDEESVAVSPAPDVARVAPGRGGLAYRVAATEHLSQAEAFLTSFRTSPRASGGEFMSRAENLLSSTWLLLDSPAADDPVFRALLEELELVLVQIVQLESEDDRSIEREMVTEGIERRGLLP
ncbi:MAG: hypothetical protein GWN32_15240, partial [Gemmatimonadetes bacterium]|nr:hypothetical protein [Gammaproteobacteria bacterium]NIW37791.1 hypothetical protein [Gemmatimonadota bacterium]